MIMTTISVIPILPSFKKIFSNFWSFSDWMLANRLLLSQSFPLRDSFFARDVAHVNNNNNNILRCDDYENEYDDEETEKISLFSIAPRISVRLELESQCGGHRASPSSRMSRFSLQACSNQKKTAAFSTNHWADWVIWKGAGWISQWLRCSPKVHPGRCISNRRQRMRRWKSWWKEGQGEEKRRRKSDGSHLFTSFLAILQQNCQTPSCHLEPFKEMQLSHSSSGSGIKSTKTVPWKWFFTGQAVEVKDTTRVRWSRLQAWSTIKKEIKISNFYFCKRLFQYFLISNSETPWSYYWHFSLRNIW